MPLRNMLDMNKSTLTQRLSFHAGPGEVASKLCFQVNIIEYQNLEFAHDFLPVYIKRPPLTLLIPFILLHYRENTLKTIIEKILSRP